MHCSYLLEEEAGGGGVNMTRNLAMCMLPVAKLRGTMGETRRLDGDQVFRNFCEGRAVGGRCQNWKLRKLAWRMENV